MVDVAPLRPLLYAAPDWSRVAAPPVDAISPEERATLAARSPQNIVHVALPGGDASTRGACAAELFASWRRDHVLVRDDEPGFYRYDQTLDASGGGPQLSRTGFFALVRLAPFAERLSVPEADPWQLELVRATRAGLSPGAMLYRDPDGALDGPLATAEKVTELATPDGVTHALSKVTSPHALIAIVDHLKKGPLLFTGGLDAYAAALRYAHETDERLRSEGAAPASSRAEHRFFLALLCNADDPSFLASTGAGDGRLRWGEAPGLVLTNAPGAEVRELAPGEGLPTGRTYGYPNVPTGLAFHTLEPTRTV